MNRTSRAILLSFVVAGMVLLTPAAALAANPASFSPMVIKTVRFDTASDTLALSGINLTSEPYTKAYWGRTTGTSVNERRGSSGNGLWCASTNYPAGTVRAYGTGLYPAYTRGAAQLDLPMLTDYYSSTLTFWYIMSAASPYPARGAADTNSFSVYWDDVARNDRQAKYDFPTTLAAWVSHAQVLSDPANDAVLSRRAGKVTFQFFDFIEAGTQSPKQGRGPTIDDIAITGYKYGPVRNLSATSGAASIQLSWGTPDRATDDPTADNRVITYRIWRKLRTATDWTELTSASSRVAGLVYTDSTAAPGTLYDYAVQAWDAGIGTGYGSYKTVSGSVTDNTAPTVTSNAVASYNNSAAITITGSDSGSGVKEIRYILDGGSVQVVSGSSATVNVSTLGAHSIQYWAVDYSNNESTRPTKNFTIVDTAAPSISTNAVSTYNNAATIKITATDSGSGVKEVRYTLDGGTTVVTSGSVAQLSTSVPGAHALVYWAVDKAGNQTAHLSLNFTVVDTLAPTVSSNAVASYDNAASITITASDSGSGVKEIRYRVDGGTEQVAAGSTKTVAVNGIGAHTLTFWAVDKSGNSAAQQVVSFSVRDTIVPTVSSNAVSTYNNTASITITASDSGSGVKEIRYRLDGGAEQVAAGSTKTVTVTAIGARSLQFWAVDKSLNASVKQTANFTISDTLKPTVSSNAGSSYNNSASIAITGSDTGSGVKEIRYSLNGGTVVVVAGASATVNVSTIGSHKLEYWAIDKASLSSDHQIRNFTIASGPVKTVRLADRTRFDTAVKIGRAGFDPKNDKSWPGVTNVIIASGDDRGAADPLAAAGLVWRYNGPLFLVSATGPTPSSVKTAIAEIAAANKTIKVHVVGGPVAVPDARYNEIKAAVIAAGGSVVDATAASARIMGDGRYATAARIAELMAQKADPPVILIANGADYNKFSDALALSAISAQKGYPILLVQQGSAPSATLNAISARHKGDRVIVAGGINTVSDAAARQVAAAAGYSWNAANDRWSGANRYDTATAVATKAISAGWLSASTIGVAAKLPDALAGGAFVGYRNGVLLLTPSTSLYGGTANWIDARKATVSNSYVFGGVVSLTDGVRTAIDGALD